MLKLLQAESERSEELDAARTAVQCALDETEKEGFVTEPLPEQSEWALPIREQRFLASVISHLKPRHILEFGSGSSTRVLARGRSNLEPQCSITSIEHDPDFRNSTIHELVDEGIRDDGVTVQFAPLVLRDCGGKLLPVYRLRPHRFASSELVDLVLIDGPPLALGGREGTLYQAMEFAKTGTLLLLDDANRAEERAVLSRWQDNLGDAIEIKLLPQFPHGMAAILVHNPVTSSDLWNHRIRLCRNELRNLVPRGRAFILVDEGLAKTQLGYKSRAIPFLERDGEYFGPPENDAAAISELERLGYPRASFMVFLWPAFWWLEHYSGFREHLHSHYRVVLENDRLLVFDLRP